MLVSGPALQESIMPIEEEPMVGATYEDEEGRTFEVVSFDEDEGNIEIKFEDDTVNTVDLDAWYEMEVTRISSPEDDADDDDDYDEDDEDFEDDEDDDDDFDDDDEDEQ
jgi:hypothetical protein